MSKVLLFPYMERVLAFWLGACLGSFINVVAYRLPKEESVVSPGSRCPRCRRAIAFHDNVPILSWLMLGGRCRHCRKPISPRYPVVEALMACLSLGLWERWQDQPLWAALVILAAGALLAVALIDWDTMLIPDELSLGLLGLGLAAGPFNPLLGPGLPGLLYALRGAAIGLAICWGTAWAGERIFKKEAMGGGDVKLLAAVGAWTGGVGAFDCLLLGSFLGSLYGLALILRRRLTRSDPIPFGPFLSLGAIFNFFVLLPLGFPFS